MNAHELAKLLNGREYRSEITDQECKSARKSGLLVVFGYSDDLVELRGVINDEVSAYDGTTFQVSKLGLVRSWSEFLATDPTESDAIDYFEKKRSVSTITIIAKWGGEPVWSIAVDGTTGDVAEFIIMEDGEPFCRGIVVKMS